MDVAALSSAMSMAQVQSAWGTQMLDNTMDQTEIQGAQLAQMISAVAPPTQMELSVNPSVGGNLDIRI